MAKPKNHTLVVHSLQWLSKTFRREREKERETEGEREICGDLKFLCNKYQADNYFLKPTMETPEHLHLLLIFLSWIYDIENVV